MMTNNDRNSTATALDDRSEQAKAPWTRAMPVEHLTWGRVIDGRMTLETILRCCNLKDADVVEIGPGQGRLLDAILEQDKLARFTRYVGLDICPDRVDALSRKYASDRRISFRCNDIDAEAGDYLGIEADVILSTLTFKHFHPDFGRALRNCLKIIRQNGRLLFDTPFLYETSPWAEQHGDNGGYVRNYNEFDVTRIVGENGWLTEQLTTVHHTPQDPRRLVVSVPNPHGGPRVSRN